MTCALLIMLAYGLGAASLWVVLHLMNEWH